MDSDITTLDRADRIGLYLTVALAMVAIAFVGWGVDLLQAMWRR